MVTKEEAKNCNEELKDTMVGNMGIEILPSNDECIHAKMKVTSKTCQNYRMLHGGAALALAETIAGIGSYHVTGRKHPICGAQVSGSHVHPAMEGETVFAKATLLQAGNAIHVWNVDITNEEGKLVSTERVTNYIIRKVSM